MSSVSAAVLIAGRYRLDHQIATDRFGEVWRGTDIDLARPVAVKFLRAEAGDADAVNGFRAAACRGASLSHECLIRVFDYCEPEPSDTAQRPFLVMEYVDGQSLAGPVGAGPLGPARTIDIVTQVAAALVAVHRAGLAHGDITPEKILLSRGAAKLFGFSSMRPASAAAIGADLRALGILARQCLGEPGSANGSRPVSGQLAASAAKLVAELCAHRSADDEDATAAIARRAASLRAETRQASAPARGPGPSPKPLASPSSPGSGSPASTMPLPRLPAGPNRPAVAPTGRPAPRVWQEPAKRGRRVAVGTAAVIALAFASIAIFGAFKPEGTSQQADGATKADQVRVTAARLIGRPVDVIRLRLQRLGLIVRIRWQDSDRVSAGHVVAVRPAGLVPAHSLIVIVGSNGRPASADPAVGQRQITHQHRNRPRSGRHAPASEPPTAAPSPSPSTSSSAAPSPSTSPSPAPSSTPSPPDSSSPPSSPPPSSTPPPPGSPAG